MLALKPNCECCDSDIAPDSDAAFICTFECTYCAPCTLGRLEGVCPTCKGNLTPRPVRTAAASLRYPAQTERVPQKAECLQ